MIEIDTNLSREQPLSRYMSLAKFLDILKRRRLYFPALSQFADQHEGSSTQLNMMLDTGVFDALHALVNYDMTATLGVNVTTEERVHLRAKSEELRAQKRNVVTPFGPFEITDNVRYQEVMLGQRSWTDVSCWHRSVDESLAMWQIYGGGAESVCIISTVGDLISSLEPTADVSMYIHPVHYIDHRNQHFQTDHLLAPAIHKQKAYSYENEVRVIALNRSSDILTPRKESGRYIDIDPNRLITALRLSPKAPTWFRELIEHEVLPHLQISIYQSDLDNAPIFGGSES